MQARSSAVPRNASPKAFPAARSFAAAAIEIRAGPASGRSRLPPRPALARRHRAGRLDEPLGRSRAVARLRPASPAARLVGLADDAALRLPRPSRQRRPDELHAGRRPARRRLRSCGFGRRRRPDRSSGVRPPYCRCLGHALAEAARGARRPLRHRRSCRSLRLRRRRALPVAPSDESRIEPCATPSNVPRAIRSDMPIGWRSTRLEPL